MMDRDDRKEERPSGHVAAVWAHLMAMLAFPFYFREVVSLAWEFEIALQFYNYFLAAVPLAPLITYLIYSLQRRKPEAEREQEWARFQTLQALLWQVGVLIFGFSVAPTWKLGAFPIGLVLYGLVVAIILYGLLGAILIRMGLKNFVYPGIGPLARKIVQGRYRHRE
jgi:uncharacterized membrane protein